MHCKHCCCHHGEHFPGWQQSIAQNDFKDPKASSPEYVFKASSPEYNQDQLEQERTRSKSLPPRQHQRK